MKFYITEDHPRYLGHWALCSVDGQIVERCGSNDGGYIKAVRALVASADGESITAAADAGELVPWESDPAVAYLNLETSDHRIFEAFTFRQFPMPLLAQTTTNMGHEGAYICGRVDVGEVANDQVTMTGVFNDDPESVEVTGLVAEQMLRTVSVDMAAITMETIVTEFDDDGWPTEFQYVYHSAEIAALTLTPVSAFADARIKVSAAIAAPVPAAPAPAATPAASNLQTLEAPAEPVAEIGDKKFYIITAAGVSTIPIDPPLAWFDQPDFQSLTRWTVKDDGRVYGHLAPWGQCHVGVQDRCVIAPKSATAYGYYMLGRIKCDEGCQIDIGTITMDTGHADKRATARAAAGHYDDTGFAVADVVTGEDKFGIWVAGAMRPNLDPAKVRDLRAAKLSGDWRGIGGNLELIATLAVNVPGFPTYDEYVGASGQTETLIASLMPVGNLPTTSSRNDTALERELAALTRFIKPQLDAEAARLRDRVVVVPQVERLRDRVHAAYSSDQQRRDDGKFGSGAGDAKKSADPAKSDKTTGNGGDDQKANSTRDAATFAYADLDSGDAPDAVGYGMGVDATGIDAENPHAVVDDMSQQMHAMVEPAGPDGRADGYDPDTAIDEATQSAHDYVDSHTGTPVDVMTDDEVMTEASGIRDVATQEATDSGMHPDDANIQGLNAVVEFQDRQAFERTAQPYDGQKLVKGDKVSVTQDFASSQGIGTMAGEPLTVMRNTSTKTYLSPGPSEALITVPKSDYGTALDKHVASGDYRTEQKHLQDVTGIA